MNQPWNLLCLAKGWIAACFLAGGEGTVKPVCMEDQLSSSDPVAVPRIHADGIPSSSSSARDFSQFAANEGHLTSSNPPLMGMAGGRGERGGGRAEMGTVTRQGIMIADAARASAISRIESEGQKNDFSTSPPTSESISQALHCLQDSSLLMMSGGGNGGRLPIQLQQQQQQQQGLIPHRSGLTSRMNKPPPPPSNSHYHHHHHHERDGFGVDNLMSSQDNNSLQPDHALALQITGSSGSGDASSSSETALARSLSYPNLSNLGGNGDDSSTGTIMQPGEGPTSKSVLTHSQAPILTHSQTNPPLPFPANLGSLTFSSMVGHFTPQLQPQSLPTTVNPSSGGGGGDGRSGIMQSLGVSLGSNNRSSNTNIISISSQSRLPIPSNTSLSSSSVSNLLGGGGLNPSLSIVNPPASFNIGVGGGRGANLPPSSNISRPLAHPIASNPSSLPLLSGMPAVYSYPYTATLPTQSISTSMVRVNAPGPTRFPPPGQTLVPGGYHQYVPQSAYGNSQQPPVSTCNFTI